MKIIKKIFPLIFICIFLIGCNPPDEAASNNESIASGMSMDSMKSYDDEAIEESTEEPSTEEPTSISTNRKLIKDVDLEFETKDIKESQEIINKQISKYDGYIENSNFTNGDFYNPNSFSTDENKTLYLKIRVDSSKLDSFLKDIGEVGTIQSENYNVRDVTLKYSDLETHKNTLKVEQERILALLNEATNLEYILQLEDKLSDIRYELESYESQLKLYSNLIDYSTVNITLKEDSQINKTSDTMKERIVNGWKDSLFILKNLVENFIVFIIVNSPFILLFVIIVFIFIKIGRKLKKRYKNKLEAKFSKESPDKIKEILKVDKKEKEK